MGVLGLKEAGPFKLSDAENNAPIPFAGNAFAARVGRHDFRVFRLDRTPLDGPEAAAGQDH